jgi:cell division protein FtsN
MTRDYKKPMRSSKKKPLPGWVWLFTGLAIGLFVSVLIWLKDLPDSGAASVVEQSREEIRTRTQQVEEVEEEKPRFDFYTLLPELEVVIPEGDYVVEPARQPKKSTTSKPVVEEPGSYRLQAGSFKSLDEADRLKARLALLGVEASIQTVKVNKATWHRVQLGPYGNLDEVNAVRKRLDHHHINTLLMKNSG